MVTDDLGLCDSQCLRFFFLLSLFIISLHSEILPRFLCNSLTVYLSRTLSLWTLFSPTLSLSQLSSLPPFPRPPVLSSRPLSLFLSFCLCFRTDPPLLCPALILLSLWSLLLGCLSVCVSNSLSYCPSSDLPTLPL